MLRAVSERPLTIAWLRHACCLLDFGGFRVLLDPWLGPSVLAEPAGVGIKHLPSLDLLLLTGGSRAEAHGPTLSALGRRQPALQAAGRVADRLADHGLKPVDLASGERRNFGPLAVTAHGGPQQVHLEIEWEGARLAILAPARRDPPAIAPVHVALVPAGFGLLPSGAECLARGRAVGARFLIPLKEGRVPTPAPTFETRPGDPTVLDLAAGEEATFTGRGDELYVYGIDPMPRGRAERFGRLRRLLG
jgi:hypothetical protein